MAGFSLPSLVCYALLPVFPIWLILSSFFVSDPGEIPGLSWYLFLLLAIVFFLSFLLDKKCLELALRLFCRRFFLISFFLVFLWLLIMGVLHGFQGGNLIGVLSGFCFLLALPALIVVGGSLPTSFPVLVCLWVGAVMCAENYFLFDHVRLGVPLSSLAIYDFDGVPIDQLPRVFRNARDGNSVAILSLGSGFCLFSRWVFKSGAFVLHLRRLSLVDFGALMLSFFSASMGILHGIVTSGRGVFLSVFSGFVYLFVSAIVRKSGWLRFFVHAFFLALSFLVAQVVCKICLGLDSFSVVANRFEAVVSRPMQSPRLLIWLQAIGHRFETNFLWGDGFNFNLTSSFGSGAILGEIAIDPHNIVVMLFLYAGLSGLAIALFLSCFVISFLLRQKSSDGFEPVVFVCSAFGSYLMVHSVLSWSAGCWAVCISLILVLSQLRLDFLDFCSGNLLRFRYFVFSRQLSSVAVTCFGVLYCTLIVKLASLK